VLFKAPAADVPAVRDHRVHRLNFINGCLTEGMSTFITNEGLIKHLPAPLTVYGAAHGVRQTLMFLHNLIVYVIMIAIYFSYIDHTYHMDTAGQSHPGLGLWSLSAIPAFFILALNGLWLTLLVGIVSTRYRNIPQVINIADPAGVLPDAHRVVAGRPVRQRRHRPDLGEGTLSVQPALPLRARSCVRR